jgi:hypothetical protein
MKARSGHSGFRTILLLDIFLEDIKRNSTAGVHEVRIRPKNRFTVKLIDLFRKLLSETETSTI